MDGRRSQPGSESKVSRLAHSVGHHATQAMKVPPHWVDMYEDFIAKNAHSVAQIESALRSLTYIIPGRFRDAEMASESLHSFIQLLSLYHDSLLARAVSRLPGMPKIPNRHNRYTRFWSAKSSIYRRTALLLQMIQYTELLWEMAAKRKGEKVRWRVIVILEMVKAVCRMLLLRITGRRMVVSPGLPERDEIPEPEEETQFDEEEDFLDNDSGVADLGIHSRSKKEKTEWQMPRTGLSLPNLPAPTDVSSFLLSRVLTAEDVKPASTLLRRVQGSARLAELIHIFRPVIYAILLSRRKDKKSWSPWLIGISLELLARQLRKEGVNVTGLEKEEWNKRAWNMGWWSMRGAFYENVTKGVLQGAVNRLPTLVGGIVEDYKYLYDNYYFSTATM